MNFDRGLDRLGALLVKDGKKNWPAVALLYLGILLPIVFLAVYSSLRARQDLTRSVWSQRLDLAYFSATAFREKLNRLTDLSVSLASRVRFRRMVSEGKWQEAIEILSSVPRDFPFVDGYFLTDPKGTLMVDFPATDVRGRNFAVLDWYQGVSQKWQPYISNSYQRAAAPGLNVIAAAVPVKGDDGQPVAILVLQVTLESLRDWIKGIDAGEQGSVLVADKKGKLVVHPSLELQSAVRDVSAIGAVQKALQGMRGVETIPPDAPDGTEQLLAYAPVADYGWAVVVQQPTRAAYAGRERGLLLAVTTYGLVFLLSCLLAHVILSILIRVKRVEESRSQLASIVESSDAAIFSATLRGKIITWNKGAEHTYGYSQREAEGGTVELLVPDDHSGESAEILASVRRGETVDRYETVHATKSGNKIDVSLTVSPIRNGKGTIVGASVIGRDITPRKRLRQELQEKNRILEQQYNVVREANRLKSEFLANMSHELRTPLNAIIGFSQLMHDGKVGPVSPDHKEYLGDVLTSGRHLLELINDVLDLAKVDSGTMEFNPEPVHLPDLILQVRTILQSVAAGKHLSITTEVAPEIEKLVIDRAKLKQVLYNYLSNACKFTPEGGRISIQAVAEDSDHFRLAVKDTGPGIPPERIGELFLEFKQLEPGLSKKHQGTGLGLALSKKIVEAQGGSVGIETSAGQGSLFYAVLPICTTQAIADIKKPTSLTFGSSSGPRVLVVDDDENDLNWLNKTLSQAGYAVDCATTGAEAVAKAQSTAYNAILLDLILPDSLGWDVLKSIRNAPLNQDAPVIVVTVVSEKAAAKSFAVQDYLAKPVSAAALLGSLRRTGVMGNGIGKKILVVDDDPAALKLAASALESSGYQASCHMSGATALVEAAQAPIDAVVIDLLMPEMDGFEFLERLRGLANCTDTPVIVWTAKSITIAEREKLKSSANSIALKGQGGIEAVLRELRYHVAPAPEAAP